MGGRRRTAGRTLASMTMALDMGPPCTTLWPTTAMSFMLEMGPCFGSVRSDTISTKAAPESLMRLAAVYWGGWGKAREGGVSPSNAAMTGVEAEGERVPRLWSVRGRER